MSTNVLDLLFTTMSNLLKTFKTKQLIEKNMNQLCRVCSEPAAGFHFGAFTCEGCKSFFGRTCNNVSSLGDCKNDGKCVITRKNRTACKSCRLNKCLQVGMSKSGSRYGRRSNWFKIHCLMQDQTSETTNEQDVHDNSSPLLDHTEPKCEIKIETESDYGPASTSSPSISSSEHRVTSDELNIVEFLSNRSKILPEWYNTHESQPPPVLQMLSAISPFLLSSPSQFSDLSRYYSLLSLFSQSGSQTGTSDKQNNKHEISDNPVSSGTTSRVSCKRKAEESLSNNNKVPRFCDNEQHEPMDLSIKRAKKSEPILSCSMTVTTLESYDKYDEDNVNTSESDCKTFDLCSG